MGWNQLPDWLKSTTFWKKDLVKGGPTAPATPDDANLVSSWQGMEGGVNYHIPVLDIDMPVWVTESSTPGHYHLSINKPMTADNYEKLLTVLHEVGILQKGIIDMQWKEDKMTCIRMPGTKKEPSSPSSGGAVILNKTVTGTVPSKNALKKINHAKVEWELVDAPASIPDAPASISAAQVSVINNSPVQTVKIPTLVEQETLDKWATDTLPALSTLEKLAEISNKTGKSLTTMVDAWYHLLSKFKDLDKSDDASW